jgi:hypothetical protein
MTTTNMKHESEYNSGLEVSGELGAKIAKVKTKLSETDSEVAAREEKEEYRKSKIDFHHRQATLFFFLMICITSVGWISIRCLTTFIE